MKIYEFAYIERTETFTSVKKAYIAATKNTVKYEINALLRRWNKSGYNGKYIYRNPRLLGEVAQNAIPTQSWVHDRTNEFKGFRVDHNV